MIEIFSRIHDRFNLEFKVLYKALNPGENEFLLNSWIFVPNTLGINKHTYSRDEFYKDVRLNIRLITPSFPLADIVKGEAVPLRTLENAVLTATQHPSGANLGVFEYNIKMFAAIFKSAIRDESKLIFKNGNDAGTVTNEILTNILEIIGLYRKLNQHIPETAAPMREYYSYGDEFLSNLVEKELFGMLQKFRKNSPDDLYLHFRDIVTHLINKEKEYCIRSGYMVVDPGSETRNSELVHRLGGLKKYIESDLFLKADKKSDAVYTKQLLYSLAAGLSMIFATAIAFAFQFRYGTFTMPLFIALVVSYMLKDRIKELTRTYFTNKFNTKYFDNRIEISLQENEIGWSKEGFDFMPDNKVPTKVLFARNRLPLVEADNRYDREKIILYRKRIMVNREILSDISKYNSDGIVEVIRLNVTNFIKNMDNAEVPLYALDEEGDVQQIMGVKNYFINVVMQYTSGGKEIIHRYRVMLNRDGINEIRKFA